MAKKTRKRSQPIRRTHPSGRLATVSLSDLQAELRRRQRAARPLLQRRERLIEQLAAIESQLDAQGVSVAEVTGATSAGSIMSHAGARSGSRTGARRGRPPGRTATAKPKRGGRRGGRGPNSMNLVEALQKVLSTREMAVKDVVGAVQEAGYVTSSPNFRTIVNQALTSNTDVFRKVSRGVYTAR